MLKVDKEICRSRVSLTSFLEDVQNVFHRKKSIAVAVRNALSITNDCIFIWANALVLFSKLNTEVNIASELLQREYYIC